ncbi:MAG TPA: creatininase family protein [Longimicrobium sp.]|nr:creatininase family protein [Longimicrobium sp.]
MLKPMRSYAIGDLPWTDVAAHLEHDRRLIIPVGACDQSGPHLPVGAGTCVAEALARDLSQEFGVLRAPTFHYGVNLPGEDAYAGTSALRAKTLHRALNEMLAVWTSQGFDEFIAITANAHVPHSEAIATLRAPGARVRVVEALNVNLSALLDGETRQDHAGEALTSLLLHLRPHTVLMDRVRDPAEAPGNPGKPRKFGFGRPRRIPPARPGTRGSAALATAEKGRLIYEHILQKIRLKVFIAPPPDED